MLKQMMNFAVMYLGNKKGQGMVEYALIIALVAIVVIAALTLLGPQIADVFRNITDRLGEET